MGLCEGLGFRVCVRRSQASQLREPQIQPPWGPQRAPSLLFVWVLLLPLLCGAPGAPQATAGSSLLCAAGVAAAVTAAASTDPILLLLLLQLLLLPLLLLGLQRASRLGTQQ